MRVLSNSDYKLIERLVSLSQKGMHEAMSHFLKARYDNKVIVTKDYIVAIGDIPIALVAHMDTVFKTPVADLYYDQRKGVLWSPQGLGADDRAGIFAIMKIIESGLRPSVILTTDEEQGGLGATALASQKCPIPNLKYMIQLDRHGTNDCVFYECFNEDFYDYVESFGFVEAYGSFSDISFLMPQWLVCGVNLSVGYEDEHSDVETLHIAPLFDTIRKVQEMLLDAENAEEFEYDELVFSSRGSSWWKNVMIYGQHCSHCNKLYSEYELFPVIGIDKKTKFYCPDCIVGNVDWCDTCGEAFEIEDPAKNEKICKICAEVVCTTSEKSKNNSAK